MAEPTPKPNWTPSQFEAIRSPRGGLLLSAAAGSGKTATLSERVAWLVCESPDPVPVEKILVVTFTRNAATEMRARIDRALQAKARECGSDHARRQVLLSGRATIGTIHSFCSRLIRRHFQRLGVDPKFATLEEQQATLLQQQVLRETLDAAHLADASGAFRSLIEWYGGGDDNAIGSHLLNLHHFLSTLPDSQTWTRQALARLESAALDPRQSDLGREFTRQVSERVELMRDKLYETLRIVGENFPEYDTYIHDQLLPWVDKWEQEIAQGQTWNLTPPPTEFARATPIRDDRPGKEAAQKLFTTARDLIKDGPTPEGLPADEAYWKQSLSALLPHMRELLRLTGEFGERFQAAKQARRVLDFNDLERFTLRLLEDPEGNPSDIARMLHEQYRHVLVDECQDINGLQDRLLSLISTECLTTLESEQSSPQTLPPSNLFSVGDVKQSIYRFRQADPRLFAARMRRYQQHPDLGRVIALSENFRSRGPLLHAINEVFLRLMVGGRTEIDYSKDEHLLKPGATFPEGTFKGAPLELHLLPAKPRGSGQGSDEEEEETDDLDLIEREAELIARRIRDLLQSGATVAQRDGTTRPLRFGDIAILLRTARHKGKQLASMLRLRGIPVHADVKGGLLSATEVTDVLALLELLTNPLRDLPLAAYLRSPLSLLAEPEEAMARARLAHPEFPFHEAVRHFAFGLGDAYASALADALSRIDTWREMSRRRTVVDLLDDIYNRTYYLTYVSGLPDGPQRRANLDELLDLASTFSSQADPETGSGELARFTAFLRAVEEQSELSQAQVAPGAEDVVRILTIHKAKGLEYPVVFLPDLGKRFNLAGDMSPSVLFSPESGLAPMAPDEAKQALYPSPAWILGRQAVKPALLAEELRILYVAMTRAREHLILIGTLPPTTVERIKAAYHDATARLSQGSILSATNALEWVLPVTFITEAVGRPIADLRTYTDEQIAELTRSASASTQRPIPEAILRLEPLPSPAPSPEVEEVLSRLDWRYGFEPFTQLPSARSVTSLTHGPTPPSHTPAPHPLSTTPAPSDALPDPPPGPDALLPLPRFLAADTSLLPPTERGTATHLALEHFDFTATPLDDKGIVAQLDRLVEKHLLTSREAAAVSVGSIRWLAESELAPYLRGQHGRLFRELPVYMPHTPDEVKHLPPPATSPDPMDCQMIRGRIDLLIDTTEGPVVIDYKTDNVWGDRLEERVAQYARQVAFYKLAAEAITGKPCVGVYLAFISDRARAIRRL